ncbi:MAG: CARDB domain-containing protein, partial [bacterium]
MAGGFTGAYDATSRVVTFSSGTLAAGGSVTLKVSVQTATAGTYTVPAGGAIVDPANTVSESNEGNNGSPSAVSTVVSNATVNTPPVSEADVVATTPFLSLSVAGPATVSGVIDD